MADEAKKGEVERK